ncbi:Chemotaxis protein CheY-P-specific phosphatase CheC [Pseudomonas syringae pv. actinidiae]|uniref:Chemotaxis protein CheY-P-specific phosphatase CheC n=1 Tax=Pseudomonas syringae pv. actinidiae TaxID=103796 RepID=A0AAN4TIW0_PSESF|nr:Chemotaxis protein CheY-P-specific phosphatase CheC [Pseudomonas syringae pv. actinidiae]
MRVNLQVFVGSQVLTDQSLDDACGRSILKDSSPHFLLAHLALISQITGKDTNSSMNCLQLKEILVRTASGKGNGLRISLGHFIKEVHGVQRRVSDAGVQVV